MKSFKHSVKHALKRIARRISPEKVVRHDGFVVAGAFEDYGFLKALSRGEREPYTTKLFVEHLRPGATVVDIGAHIGHFTLLAARAVGEKGRVIAFEPHPRNLRYLEKNVNANHFDPRVQLVASAVGASDGTVTFYADEYQSDCSSVLPNLGSGTSDSVTVALRSLDSFFSKETLLPAVIKIDVEGAELEALKGMSATLERIRISGEKFAMFIECNEDALQHAGSSVRKFIEQLSSYGLKPHRIIEKEKRIEILSPSTSVGVCENLLLTF